MTMERKSGLLKFGMMMAVVFFVDLIAVFYSRCAVLDWERTYKVAAISVSEDEYGEQKDIPMYRQKVTVEHEGQTWELDWESDDCKNLYQEGDTVFIKKDKKDGDRMKIISFWQTNEVFLLFCLLVMCPVCIKAMTIEWSKGLLLLPHSMTLCLMTIIAFIIQGSESLVSLYSLIICITLMVGLATETDSLSFWADTFALMVISLLFIDGILYKFNL